MSNNATQASQEILDKVIGQIFGYKNPFTLERFLQKYAFDVELPQKVNDSTTGEETWTQSPNPSKFISIKNAWDRQDWEKPATPLNTIEDVIAAWGDINYTATERYLDSDDVHESDNIYSSEHVFRSQDITASKYILFSDGVKDSDYIVAGQRSQSSTYCARVEDSQTSSNSFSVIWSKKIVNSFFIQDCADMYECMFCSHIANKKFCIANMQYEEAEYRRIKEMVVRWILS
jgi:hypothetical protein